MFDRTFVLISEADCCFNREFYYNASDYDGAEFYADIDDFHEVVPFGKDEAEVPVRFRNLQKSGPGKHQPVQKDAGGMPGYPVKSPDFPVFPGNPDQDAL